MVLRALHSFATGEFARSPALPKYLSSSSSKEDAYSSTKSAEENDVGSRDDDG